MLTNNRNIVLLLIMLKRQINAHNFYYSITIKVRKTALSLFVYCEYIVREKAINSNNSITV